MAAYAQYNCGYPPANQFLVGGALPSLSTHPSSQSPALASTPNAPSLSPPSNGLDSSGSSGGCGSTGGATESGTLTPDPASQASTAGTSSAATNNSAETTGSAYACAAVASSSLATNTTQCCDNGRPMVTDPVTGQTVCSCQYDPTRLALSSYTRMQSAAGVGVYGTPYPSNEQNPYPSIGVDSTPFYTTLGNPYALKDSSNSADVAAWTSAGLQPSAGYYTYDPTFGAYGYGASYDLASRRKNATRESTATLKAWLNEHKKNPYPTKGEKIMLAIITKMTLTQVSTWFANARRRLKKENKMTWEPKNRAEDDDDALVASDEEKEHRQEASALEKRREYGASVAAGSSNSGTAGVVEATASATTTVTATGVGVAGSGGNAGAVIGSHNTGTAGVGVLSAQPKELLGYSQHSSEEEETYQVYSMPQREYKYHDPAPAYPPRAVFSQAKESDVCDARPKIWSLADTAAETKPTAQFPTNTMAPLTWPAASYAQHYGHVGSLAQTSVVATISMQPSAPMPEMSPQVQQPPCHTPHAQEHAERIRRYNSANLYAHAVPSFSGDGQVNGLCFKDSYQQQQYSQNFYYSSSQPPPPSPQHHQFHATALSALTQHVADNALWQSSHQQQSLHHHHQQRQQQQQQQQLQLHAQRPDRQ